MCTKLTKVSGLMVMQNEPSCGQNPAHAVSLKRRCASAHQLYERHPFGGIQEVTVLSGRVEHRIVGVSVVNVCFSSQKTKRDGFESVARIREVKCSLELNGASARYSHLNPSIVAWRCLGNSK